jgi:hypothetical protein
VRKGFSIAGRVAYSANMFLKIKTVCLHVIIPEMPSFSMRPAKYFYDNPLPKYLDPKTVLIYRPHPVYKLSLVEQVRCAVLETLAKFYKSGLI